jgi:divalent metal cation (Fe/Co/Zn/Cd) transporter
MEVHLEGSLTTRQIERLMDKIKLQVKKEVPSVKHIQVELETP